MKSNLKQMSILLLSGLMLLMVNGCQLLDRFESILEGNNGKAKGKTKFMLTIENVFTPYMFFQSGVFNKPVGAAMPGPILDGDSYQFQFHAGEGHYLSFATMFVQSNDLFYAPGEMGIPMFKNGVPTEGDITMYVDLWDAGTEIDEAPGAGNYQPTSPSGPDEGPDEGGNVVIETGGGFSYPDDAEVIKVYSEYLGDNQFEVTIMNVSGSSSLPTPLAPGVFVVHSNPAPLFTEGAPDRDKGLEALAEDGSAGMLGDYLAMNTGLVSPFAPGVFVTQNKNQEVLFMAGEPDAGHGLEGLAEDGMVSDLAEYLEMAPKAKESGIFNTPSGAGNPGPILPGHYYEIEFEANPGQSINFATMLIQSNDLFFAPDDTGIPLFDKGEPISGDVTMYVELWDAGTEVNQFPGAGNYQAPRQDEADMGMDENGVLQVVDDEYMYPAIEDMIRVTIMPYQD